MKLVASRALPDSILRSFDLAAEHVEKALLLIQGRWKTGQDVNLMQRKMAGSKDADTVTGRPRPKPRGPKRVRILKSCRTR